MTDVHGYYDLYKAAIDYCNKQDPEYSLIFLGDACDRGPDGYKIMRELLDNPQVVYLKGNHEDMFVKAARFILNDLKKSLSREEAKRYLYSLNAHDYCYQVQESLYNGGLPTLIDWIVDGMPNEFITRISKLPLTFSLDTIDFCHAGARPDIFARVAQDEYDGEIPDMDDEEMILWDRNFIHSGWVSDKLCVFGHTPTSYILGKKDKEARPCKFIGNINKQFHGGKIAMDVGTAHSGKLYVLNCLTLKAVGFKDLDFKNNDVKNHNVEQIEEIDFSF